MTSHIVDDFAAVASISNDHRDASRIAALVRLVHAHRADIAL